MKKTDSNALFPNLIAELARANLSKSDLAGLVDISVSTIYGKFKGETEWALDEMEAIRSELETSSGTKLTLDYLFRKEHHNG